MTRQVTRLDQETSHQTQVLTSRRSLEVTEVATKISGRWREENPFRFMRPRGLDAMDSYAKIKTTLPAWRPIRPRPG